MKQEIKVPAMGESISEATIGEILKPSGSQVKQGDEILELETEKVNQVLYAQETGIISLNVKQGDEVKIGQIIGYVDAQGQASQKEQSSKEEPKKEEPIKKEKEQKKPVEKGTRVSNEEFLSQVTIPEKAETKKSEPQKQTPAPQPTKKAEVPSNNEMNPRETRKKMSKIRQVIARRLVEAQQSTAMLTTFNEIDMTQVMHLREKYKDSFVKEYGVKLGFMSFFVKAVVEALKEYPDINSYIDGDEIVHREYYDISIAVSTDRGLVTPVVRNCDMLTFAEIEKAIENYAKKARDGYLSMDDLQGGGFTITNGGVYGSLLSTPIINPPQSAILGMHKIEKRPIVIDDQVVIKPMMYAALSYDHRIVDGKEAVSFLVTVKNCLEDLARLSLHI